MLYLSRDNYQVSRKLAFVEDELEVAEDRVKSGDAKISELEEELKVSPIFVINKKYSYDALYTKTLQ